MRERIPIGTPRPITLLYPQWDTASHAPTAEANTLAGLMVHAKGQSIPWRREPTNPFAFDINPPSGTKFLDIDFEFLSPTSPGRLEITPHIVALNWASVVLYSAGWFARDIPIKACLQLPQGFGIGTSLIHIDSIGSCTHFSPVSLETLVDSPVYAGQNMSRIDLGFIGTAPVSLDLTADRAEAIEVSHDEVAKLRTLLTEAHAVFEAPHFGRYDFLVSISDTMPHGGGVEHLRSSEKLVPPDFFSHPERNLIFQDILPHEFTHSWNGKFRTPEGLWTPDLNTPSQDGMLWIYEGQTEYWGLVLAARAGLLSRQQTLDLLAVKAAAALGRTGRSWKSLADSNLDPVYDANHSVVWPDWQGREAYYVEGIVLWLDVDTRLRDLTGGRRSLDDFARNFFGVNGSSEVTQTFTLADVCTALSHIAPMDWSAFFEDRLNAHDARHLLDGLRRGGYDLVLLRHAN